MPRPLEVLVACSRSEDRQALARILVRRGLKPVLTSSVEKSRETLARRPIRLAFCDDELPDGSVGALLEEVHQAGSRVPVIVISRLENWDEYLRAMRLGAFDYISSPLRRAEVEEVIRRALEELPRPFSPPGHDPDGGARPSSPGSRPGATAREDMGRESTKTRHEGKAQEKRQTRQRSRSQSAARSAQAIHSAGVTQAGRA